MKDKYEPNTIRMCDTVYMVAHADNKILAAKFDSNMKPTDKITLVGNFRGQG